MSQWGREMGWGQAQWNRTSPLINIFSLQKLALNAKTLMTSLGYGQKGSHEMMMFGPRSQFISSVKLWEKSSLQQSIRGGSVCVGERNRVSSKAFEADRVPRVFCLALFSACCKEWIVDTSLSEPGVFLLTHTTATMGESMSELMKSVQDSVEQTLSPIQYHIYFNLQVRTETSAPFEYDKPYFG